MDDNTVVELTGQIGSQVAAIQNFIESGDQASFKEAGNLIPGLLSAAHRLAEQFTGRPVTEQMNIGAVIGALRQYDPAGMAQVFHRDGPNDSAYYMVKAVVPLTGTDDAIIETGELICTAP